MKTGSAILVFVISVSMLIVAVQIKPAKAEGTITIRTDGSVDPSTAPLQRFENVYTFTDNIYDSIVIRKSNIVLDGDGYTLEGTGAPFSQGVYIAPGWTGVTIENVIVKGWIFGIDIWAMDGSGGNTISANTITDNTFGIIIDGSDGNTISGNTITDNDYGMRIDGSDNTISDNAVIRSNYEGITIGGDDNTISDNTMTDNYYGLYISDSVGNIISDNTITNNEICGISVRWFSYDNTISGNTITDNDYGLYIYRCYQNTISGNDIIDNYRGIWIEYSTHGITIYHNNIINNALQAFDDDPAANHWYHPDLLEGNYWSDYLGFDDGSGIDKHAIYGDGIGDTNIPWPELDYDHYPFIHESSWTVPTKRYLTLVTAPLDLATPTGEGWYDVGTYVSIAADEYMYISSDTRYRFNGWTTVDMTEITDPALTSTTVLMDKYKTVTANYVIQHLIAFSQTGLGVSASGTVVTIGGLPKTYYDLPFGIWVDTGTMVSYNYEAYVTSSVSDKPFRLVSVDGPSSPIIVTGPTILTGNYLRAPEDLIKELIKTIETWKLPKGTEDSLTAKLKDTIHLLDIGNENGAVHKLMDFMSQVETLRGKKLTNEQADYLISEAQRIIYLIKI